jgi:hypothetical protein
MADDPFTTLTKGLRPGAPTASAKPPARQPEAASDADTEDDYYAFNNKVRPVCVELCCHRTGISYSIPYAHLGALIFNFRTARELSFTGAGLGVTIRGHNLGGIARALRLHCCSRIDDYSPSHSGRPREGKAFVESLEVKVLGSRPRDEEDKPGQPGPQRNRTPEEA